MIRAPLQIIIELLTRECMHQISRIPGCIIVQLRCCFILPQDRELNSPTSISRVAEPPRWVSPAGSESPHSLCLKPYIQLVCIFAMRVRALALDTQIECLRPFQGTSPLSLPTTKSLEPVLPCSCEFSHCSFRTRCNQNMFYLMKFNNKLVSGWVVFCKSPE